MKVPQDTILRLAILDNPADYGQVIPWLRKIYQIEPVFFSSPARLFEHLQNQLVDLLFINFQPVAAEPLSGSQFLASFYDEIPQAADLPVFILTRDATLEDAEPSSLYDITGYLILPLTKAGIDKMVQPLREKIFPRRETYFLRHFLSNLDNLPLQDSPLNKSLLKQLRETAFFLHFIAQPGSYEPDYRKKLAQVFSALFPDIDRLLLEKIDASKVEQTLQSLELIEEVSRGRNLGLKLIELVDHSNPRISSKAIKLLAKTTNDEVFQRRYLTNPDPRFVANLVEALWEKPGEAALPVFRMFYRNRVPRIRANALIGLSKHGQSDAALQGVTEMLVSGDAPMIRSALWVCEQLLFREAILDILPLLHHPEPDIPQRAQATLEFLGGQPEISPPSTGPGSPAEQESRSLPTTGQGE